MRQTTTIERPHAELEPLGSILWRRRRWLLLSVLFSVTLTAIWLALQAPVYQAQALLRVVPSAGPVLPGRALSFFEVQQFYRTEIGVLSSQRLRQRALRHAGASPSAQVAFEVRSVQQSQLLTLAARAPSAAQAADLANGLATAYQLHSLARRDAGAAGLVSHVEVVDLARAPSQPSWPRPWLSLGLALVWGAVLGIGLALLEHWLRATQLGRAHQR